MRLTNYTFKPTRFVVNSVVFFQIICILILTLSLSPAFSNVKVKGAPGKDATPLQNKFGFPMYALVVVKNPKFLTKNDNTANQLPNSPSYMDALPVYKTTTYEDYYLVKNNNQFGWMLKDQILTSPICMQAKKKDNPAYIKVLVKNNWRTVDGRKIQSIPIYNGPDQKYDIIAKVGIFEIRYAYKIATSSDDKQFIFVGNDSMWDPDYIGQTFTGWIPKEYCILWDSRIAVYYNKQNVKEREPAVIFDNAQNLLDYVKNGNDRYAIAKEVFNYKPLAFDTTRFPVLDYDKSDLEMAKIAFVGQGKNKITGKTINNESISRKKNEIYTYKNEVRNKDVLFLIDATQSMGPYFIATKNAIRSFVSELSTKEKSKFRFALAIYRDYSDGSKAFKIFTELTNEENITKFMNKDLARGYGDKDYPEAIFNGIVKSVKSVSWRKGIRSIIVIGDHGNHKNDLKRHTTSSVAEFLSKMRISFYSINVNTQSHLKSYNKLFRQQMKTIVSLIVNEGKNFIVTSESGNDLIDTENQITKALKDICTHSESLRNAASDLIDGNNMRQIETKYGTRVTNYMRKIMAEFGLTEEEINLSVWGQVVEEGWIAKFSPGSNIIQVKPWCLMTRAEIDGLVGFLANLCKLSSLNPKRVSETIKATVMNTTGDKIDDDERISEYLQRRLHIPFRSISSVLQYTPAQLQEKFASERKFRIKFKKVIGKKYEKLHFVVESKIGKLKWVSSSSKWKKEKMKEHQWLVTTKSGESYAWIPMDYLP